MAYARRGDESSDAEGGALGLNDNVYDSNEEEDASPFLVTAKTALGIDPRPRRGTQTSNDPVYMATVQGNKAVVRALLMQGHDANGNVDVDNNPPLYEAAKRGYVDIMNLLISSNADILATDEQGERETALHAAAFGNNFDAVHCLVEAAQKSDALLELLSKKNANDKTAEMVAHDHYDFKISKFLASMSQMEVRNDLTRGGKSSARRSPPVASEPVPQRKPPRAAPAPGSSDGDEEDYDVEDCVSESDGSARDESDDGSWLHIDEDQLQGKPRKKAYSLSTQRRFDEDGSSETSSQDTDSQDDEDDYHARQATVFENNDFSKKDAFVQSENRPSPRMAPDGAFAAPPHRRHSTGGMAARPLPSPKKDKDKKKSAWRMFFNRKSEEIRKFENWIAEVRREQNKVQDLLRKQRRADDECTADWEKKKVHLQEWCMKAFEKKFEVQHQRRRNLVQVVFQKLQMQNALLESLANELIAVMEKKPGHQSIIKKYSVFPESPTEFVSECISKHKGVRAFVEEQARRKKALEDIEAEVERLQTYTTPHNLKERQIKGMRCTLDVVEKMKHIPHKRVRVDLEPELIMEFASALWNYKSHKRDHFNRWLVKLRKRVADSKAVSAASQSPNPSLQGSPARAGDSAASGADGEKSDTVNAEKAPTAPAAGSSTPAGEQEDEDLLAPDQVVEFLDAFIEHMFGVLELATTQTGIVLSEDSTNYAQRLRAFAALVEAVAYPLLKSEGVFDVYLERTTYANDALYCQHKQYLQDLHPLHLGFDKDFYSEVRWQRSRRNRGDESDSLFVVGGMDVIPDVSSGSGPRKSSSMEKMYTDSCAVLERFCQCIGQPPLEALDMLMAVIHAIHKEAKEFTSRPLDAEAFFPILVWCFVHCGAANLASAVKYCEQYALNTPSITRQKYSEVMYYMTSMVGAMQWICSMSEGSKAKKELKRRQNLIEEKRFRRSDSIKAKMSSLMEGGDEELETPRRKLPGFDSPSVSPRKQSKKKGRKRIGSPATSRAPPDSLWDSPAKPGVNPAKRALPRQRKRSPRVKPKELVPAEESEDPLSASKSSVSRSCSAASLDSSRDSSVERTTKSPRKGKSKRTKQMESCVTAALEGSNTGEFLAMLKVVHGYFTDANKKMKKKLFEAIANKASEFTSPEISTAVAQLSLLVKKS